MTDEGAGRPDEKQRGPVVLRREHRNESPEPSWPHRGDPATGARRCPGSSVAGAACATGPRPKLSSRRDIDHTNKARGARLIKIVVNQTLVLAPGAVSAKKKKKNAANALHLQVVDGPGAVAGNLQYACGAIDPESARQLSRK